MVDEVTDPGVARTKLAWWQAEVAKAFAGQPTHPVMQALMPHTAEIMEELGYTGEQVQALRAQGAVA